MKKHLLEVLYTFLILNYSMKKGNKSNTSLIF